MDKKKVDDAVMQLLTKVREKKEAIKGAQKRPQWKTSCTLSISGDQNSAQSRVNIQTVRDQGKLLEICSFLIRYAESMSAAGILLNLDYDNRYMGYLTNDWLDDLKTRVKMLKVEDQKRDLDALNKRIDKLVTPEQRREMELVELQKLLQD